jgi:glycyl-tRNA synthetase beta chain
VLDAERRKEIILRTPRTSPSPTGWNWSRTKALLEEVSGLVEWPVVLMGEFEKEFPGDPG